MADVPNTTNQPSQAAPAATRRLTLVKGEHRWRFRWEHGDEAALINHVADLARDPDVPFDWFDAAIVCRQVTGSKASAADDAQARQN